MSDKIFMKNGKGATGGMNPPPIASVGSDDAHDPAMAENFYKLGNANDPYPSVALGETYTPPAEYQKGRAWSEHDRTAINGRSVRNLSNSGVRRR